MRPKLSSLLTLSSASLILSPSAFAGTSDWFFEGAFYLYMPKSSTGMDTDLGPVDATLSFKDALKNLDGAFMGTFGARKGRWSILGDYNYTDLTLSSPMSGAAYSGLETSIKTQFFSGYVLYNVIENEPFSVELGGGFRWYSTDTTFTFLPGVLPGASRRASDDWVDPIIAARARFPINEKWSLSGLFDYGGFSSGSETWQALAIVEYRFSERWTAVGGYRHISFEHQIEGSDYSFEQSGPLLGVKYRF